MAALVPSSDLVVFNQTDVFIHTSALSSTLYDDIIRGKFSVLEKNNGTFLEWRPSAGFTPEVEYEIHGQIEYGVVKKEPKSNNDNNGNEDVEIQNPLTIHINLKEISSIRRSDPRLAWSYVLFYLKDKSKLPALHFHSGGVQEMISTLQRYIWLTKSANNDKLFVVKEKDDAMESALNQFELFTDVPGASITKIFNNKLYDTLSTFSKVTNYVLSGGVHFDLQERRPPQPQDTGEDNEDEFEFLNTEEPDIIGPVIPVARGEPLQPEEWCSYINDDGIIENVHELKERIFRGGVHEDIRCEAWKYILGYYKFEETFGEKSIRKEKLKKDYLRMKNQWETISEDQEERFFEFSQRKQLVEKDAHRTDRKIPYFEGDNNENIEKLTRILLTYCMYNFDLGYVQGMSDLLSPILQLVDNEVDSFWCFVGFMKMEEQMFEVSQDLMKKQLETLGQLVKYLYPRFWDYLVDQEAENLYFCFRWILISMKREFSDRDIMTLWEALWTQTLSNHFKLFVCLAILEREKDEMMKKKYGFNEILKHINKLSGKIDLNCTLSRAESICLQLQKKDDLPDHIKGLINHPESNIENVVEDTEHQDNNGATNTEGTTTTSSNTSIRTANESVVELQADTQSVF